MSEPRRPRVIAFASGKGGVGKSLLAANVGVFLATLSKKVVAIDAAFGAANLHRLVGVSRPQGRLADALRKSGVSLAETLEPCSVPGLELISGFDSPPWTANPRPEQVAALAVDLGRPIRQGAAPNRLEERTASKGPVGDHRQAALRQMVIDQAFKLGHRLRIQRHRRFIQQP